MFVPDYRSYALPWLPLFDLVEYPQEADVILFTGGADIDPTFYGEPIGRRTYLSPARDIREKKLYDFSLSERKKFLGICRGAQFLCAMAGGRLAQHIEGHGQGFTGLHRIMNSDGEEMNVNSVHHQMMIPTGDDEVLAWAEGLSGVYLNGWDKPIEGIEVEPEVVFFPTIQGLGIQCHPEAMRKDSKAMQYFHKLIKERLM